MVSCTLHLPLFICLSQLSFFLSHLYSPSHSISLSLSSLLYGLLHSSSPSVYMSLSTFPFAVSLIFSISLYLFISLLSFFYNLHLPLFICLFFCTPSLYISGFFLNISLSSIGIYFLFFSSFSLVLLTVINVRLAKSPFFKF